MVLAQIACGQLAVSCDGRYDDSQSGGERPTRSVDHFDHFLATRVSSLSGHYSRLAVIRLATRDDIPWVWLELVAVLNIQSQGNQGSCGVELRSNVVLYLQTTLVSLLQGSLLVIFVNTLEALVVRE